MTPDPDTDRPAIGYQMNAEHRTRYAEFSQRHKGSAVAILIDGFLSSAPVFQGRIYGPGILHGGFTQAEAERLATGLRAAAAATQRR